MQNLDKLHSLHISKISNSTKKISPTWQFPLLQSHTISFDTLSCVRVPPKKGCAIYSIINLLARPDQTSLSFHLFPHFSPWFFLSLSPLLLVVILRSCVSLIARWCEDGTIKIELLNEFSLARASFLFFLHGKGKLTRIQIK